MIQSGELAEGGVCPVGHSQWIALQTLPPFAHALAVRPALPAQTMQPGGYPAPGPNGAPALQPATASAPTQPGYGPARSEPDHGQGPGATLPDHALRPTQPEDDSARAQPAYAAQPGYGEPLHSAQGAPAAKGGNRALLLGGIAATLLLLVVGGGVAAYLLFFSSGGALRIAESVPQDCEFLIEVPSVRKLVADLRDVQFLDTSLRDDKQVFDNTAASLAKAFDISQPDALALLASSETFGIAGRNLAAAPEVVIALGMKNAAPVEALLKSPRFAAAGSIGKTGERYRLMSKPAQPGQDALLNALSAADIITSVDVSSPDNEVLVWFSQAKLLVVGNSPLVTNMTQVLESGAASIQQSPAFDAAAQDFERSARLIAFVEPGFFSTITEPKLKELVDGYFKPAGPITGSMQLKPAGFLTSFIGRISGSKLPRSAAYQAPQALDLPGRLPEETFAYVASSTKTALTGTELEKLLIDQLGLIGPDARHEVEQRLGQLETGLGVSVSKLIDGVGGQTVLAVSASPATSFAGLSASPQSLGQFNLTWVLELKDLAEFQKLAAGLRTKVLPTVHEVATAPDGAGFSLTARGLPVPITLRVKFLDKYLFVTAGLSTLCDRAEAAFSKGERTLKDEPGHKSALATLPEKVHFLTWVDTGRIGDTLMQNPLLRAQLLQSGLSLDKIHLTGADRITSALSVRGEVADEVWTYRMDALNFEALAPLVTLPTGLGSRPERVASPL
jgi:hypothetical protein